MPRQFVGSNLAMAINALNIFLFLGLSIVMLV